MALVEVNVVKAQPFQRAVQLLIDLRRGETMIGLVAYREIQFRGNQIPVARNAAQRLAQHPLRFARAILIGRIEERNPAVQSRMNAANRLLASDSPRDGKPSSKAKLRNLERAIAQSTIFQLRPSITLYSEDNDVTRWQRFAAPFYLGIFEVLLLPLCSQAQQPKIGRLWKETAIETLWLGEYENCDYGYYVILPDRFVGHSSKAPSPNHGFAIDLTYPPNTLPLPDHASRYISVWNHYNAAELPNLAAITEGELGSDAKARHHFQVLNRTSVKLATLPARVVKASFDYGGAALIEEKVIAYRSPGPKNLGDIVYVLSLVTNEADVAEDGVIFNEIVAGFHLAKLPHGTCTNDN